MRAFWSRTKGTSRCWLFYLIWYLFFFVSLRNLKLISVLLHMNTHQYSQSLDFLRVSIRMVPMIGMWNYTCWISTLPWPSEYSTYNHLQSMNTNEASKDPQSLHHSVFENSSSLSWQIQAHDLQYCTTQRLTKTFAPHQAKDINSVSPISESESMGELGAGPSGGSRFLTNFLRPFDTRAHRNHCVLGPFWSSSFFRTDCRAGIFQLVHNSPSLLTVIHTFWNMNDHKCICIRIAINWGEALSKRLSDIFRFFTEHDPTGHATRCRSASASPSMERCKFAEVSLSSNRFSGKQQVNHFYNFYGDLLWFIRFWCFW